MHLSMTCPTPPHAGKGGDRLGIYLIVEVMTLPLGPIFGVNPHIYFVRAEGKRNIRLARDTRIYLSLKCSPHRKKRPRMYLLSTQLAQSSPSQASFNINTMYRIAGIFRGGKFSRKPLQLYYSNYSRAEFSRNAPSSAKNYPFCTELTVRAALCNHTLARD